MVLLFYLLKKYFLHHILKKGCDFMKLNKFIIFLYFFIVFSFMIMTPSFCAYPKLISTLNSAFEKIESWIITLSTPAAAIAVGTGVLMKKFSFGDEERIRTGKRLIRGSLFSYGFILCVDLILSAINSLLG